MATPGQGEVDIGGQWSRRRRRQQRSVAYICTLALAATSASMLVELCHESQPSLSDHDTQIAAHQVSQTAGHIRLFIILLLGDYAAAVVCWFVCMDHRQCLEWAGYGGVM